MGIIGLLLHNYSWTGISDFTILILFPVSCCGHLHTNEVPVVLEMGTPNVLIPGPGTLFPKVYVNGCTIFLF